MAATLNLELYQFAFDKSNDAIYASSNHSIVVIDAFSNKEIGLIGLSATPTSLAFDNADNELYFATTYSSSSGSTAGLTSIKIPRANLYSVIYNQTGFGQYAGPMVYVPGNDSIYLATENSYHVGVGFSQAENLTIINASSNRIVSNMTIGTSTPALSLGSMIYNSYNNYVYGVYKTIGQDGGGGSVHFIVDTLNDSLLSIPNDSPANFPESMTFNPSNGLVYMSPSYFWEVNGVDSYPIPGQNVSVWNGTNVTGKILVSIDSNSSLGSIVCCSQNGSIFVVNGTTIQNYVSTIDPSTGLVTGTSRFPLSVGTLFIDPANFDLYVSGSNETYVVPI